jgi:uncharacterized protein YebE (UPF0316 family)
VLIKGYIIVNQRINKKFELGIKEFLRNEGCKIQSFIP